MTTSIEELAKRKTELQMTLEAIGMCNVGSKSVEELVQLEIHNIKTRREFNEVCSAIDKYVNQKSA